MTTLEIPHRWLRKRLLPTASASAVLLAMACTPAPHVARADSAEADSAAALAKEDSVAKPTPPVAAAEPNASVPVDTPVRQRPASTTPSSTSAAATPTATPPSAADDSSDVAAVADTTTPLPPLPLLASRSLRDSISLRAAIRAGTNNPAWPVDGPEPVPGAILPHRRIVAFYGNPLSRRMGILGELDAPHMLAKLDSVVRQWQQADPSTPVQPALHLVAMVAQADSGRDGKYRLKMADTLVERVLSWAQSRNALVFLDYQVGTSTIQAELPKFRKFLEMPNVHVGMDPEFSMKRGHPPGTRVGTYDAADVNWVVDYLAKIVEEKQLPPKILIVHRFTRPMVTNASRIELDPRVQIVMHMDGWGAPYLKFDSYKEYVQDEPVQFTGFKLFYKNDTKRGHTLLTPPEVLALVPPPLYIQYQ